MKDNNELFELCKQVYEATGWSGTDLLFYHVKRAKKDMRVIGNKGIEYYGKSLSNFNPKQDDNDVVIPLYTSDYLLEKLPNGTTILKDVHEFKTWNVYNRKRIATYTCDSPVEALLKLTLKLHEEGLL